jgi:hypothetical protein
MLCPRTNLLITIIKPKAKYTFLHGSHIFKLLERFTMTIVEYFRNSINIHYLRASYLPFKIEFILNKIQKFSLYLTGNTLRLRYKAPPVNAV